MLSAQRGAQDLRQELMLEHLNFASKSVFAFCLTGLVELCILFLTRVCVINSFWRFQSLLQVFYYVSFPVSITQSNMMTNHNTISQHTRQMRVSHYYASYAFIHSISVSFAGTLYYPAAAHALRIELQNMRRYTRESLAIYTKRIKYLNPDLIHVYRST